MSALMAMLVFVWISYPANVIAQTEAAIKILERLDANSDGKLDPSEIPDRSRAAIERIASEAGLNANSSISINALRKRLEKDQKKAEASANRAAKSNDANRRRDGRDDRRDRNRDPNPESRSRDSGFGTSSARSSTSSSSKPKTGFGAASGSAKDPKVVAYVDSMFRTNDKNRNGYIDGKEFETIRTSANPKEWDSNKDGRLSRSEMTASISNRGTSRKASTSTANRRFVNPNDSKTTRSTSTSSQYQDRYKRYAASLLERYDKNKDGFLRKDEWSRVRNAEEADKNKDGVLTVDELASHLKGMSSSSRSTSASSASSSRDDRNERSRESRSSRSSSRDERRSRDRNRDRDRNDEDDRNTNGVRTSYRALTAHERLPAGLPGWFKDKDKNVNGQIEMAEYTTSWSDTKVKEFLEYDLNNDGVITPVECLKAER